MTTKRLSRIATATHERFEKPSDYQLADSHSETEQDQAYSVREVLIKFSQGTLPNIQQPVFYTEDEDSENFDNYDVSERPDFDMVDADNYLNFINEKQTENETLENNKEISQLDKSQKNDTKTETTNKTKTNDETE